MGDLRKTGLYLATGLTMMIIMIQHSAMGSAEINSRLHHCNGSSHECLGQGPEEKLFGFEFLMESETTQIVVEETRRMLQQGGSSTTNTLNLAAAACGRDKFGYLCTPQGNKDVKRPENCKGNSNTFNRGCHQQR
ncbi:hypothetical protein COLO4_37987 [Corchorus olitorius]|uniref:Rapid ALkalinization Factor n=1 Tax=Corchorus olitorius TaxID=93759 RepID=A0A1R3FXP2_9ROSI|nr:hypothetical protein COLO4_37987 [Corchorus olitorius]